MRFRNFPTSHSFAPARPERKWSRRYMSHRGVPSNHCSSMKAILWSRRTMDKTCSALWRTSLTRAMHACALWVTRAMSASIDGPPSCTRTTSVYRALVRAGLWTLLASSFSLQRLRWNTKDAVTCTPTMSLTRVSYKARLRTLPCR